MDYNSFYDWLIDHKNMSVRAAKDVLSRIKRVCRMLGDEQIQEDTLDRLCLVESYQTCSMFIKSQLKRSVALANEYMENK